MNYDEENVLDRVMIETIAKLTLEGEPWTVIAETVGRSIRFCKDLTYTSQFKIRLRELARAAVSKLRVEADDVLAAVTDIAFDEGTAKKERLRALELLGKHHGLFADTLKVGGAGEPIKHEYGMSKALKAKLDEIYKS